jgi:hypothetical protein
MIRTQEAGNENHSRTVTARCSQALIHGRGMQQKQLSREQHFTQNRNVNFPIIPSANIGATTRWSLVRSSHGVAAYVRETAGGTTKNLHERRHAYGRVAGRLDKQIWPDHDLQ